MSDEVELITSLHANPRNPRRITPQQMEMLRGALEEFGDLGGIVLNRRTNHLVGGHQRIAAFKAAEVPAQITQRLKNPDRTGTTAYGYIEMFGTRYSYREVDWDEEREATANIAANKHGGEFDDTLLADIMLELRATDNFDPGLTGFTEEEITELLNSTQQPEQAEVDAEPRIEEAEELAAAWGIKRGQIWQLGLHRLMCGDSTEEADVAALLAEDKPGIMVTDPPYGVNYDPEWRVEAGLSTRTAKMGRVQNDDRVDWSPAWQRFTGNVAYVWHAGRYAAEVQRSLQTADFETRAQIIWAKDRMAISRGDYHWQHEPCWYAVRAGKPGHRTDDRTQTTLWEIPAREDAGHGHATQKPVECMKRPIQNHTFLQAYDPFTGSGTTIIACEQLRRECRGMEIDPGYVAVSLQRWADATGKTPKLIKEATAA